MTDLTFVPLVAALLPHLPSIERVVVMTDEAHMPDAPLKNAVAYDSIVAAGSLK